MIVLQTMLGKEIFECTDLSNVPIASEYVFAASWKVPAESNALARFISGCRPGGYNADPAPESASTESTESRTDR